MDYASKGVVNKKTKSPIDYNLLPKYAMYLFKNIFKGTSANREFSFQGNSNSIPSFTVFVFSNILKSTTW